MKNIFDEVKIKTNILSKEEIAFLKNHPLFKELNLTDDEVKKNASALHNIILQEKRCLENPKDCFLNLRHHFNFVRNKANNLCLVCTDFCNNFKKYSAVNQHKMNMLYNSYAKTKIENVELSKKYFKNKGTVSMQNAINAYYNMWENDKKHGLYLYGEFGTGKTYLSMAFANDIIKNKNKTVCFITLNDIITKIKDSFNIANNQAFHEIDLLINKIKFCDVLFIDNLGSEYAGEWFYSNYFASILNDRNINEKLTFFNSNYNLNQLSNLFYSKMGSNKAFKMDAERITAKIKALCNNKSILISK